MTSTDDARPSPSDQRARTGSSLVSLAVPDPDDRPTVITTPAPTGDPGVAVGEVLGGFRVSGTAGVGGMASVLRATDTELGREVALKILPAAMANDIDAVARFKAEARSAARLDHENVARVFACGEERGRHFIVFEFVAGDNLRTIIDRRGPLPAAECVGLMLQVAAGLGHAASRGVVHRDIKPSNIVVTPDGRAKIVDMGLARNLDQPANGGVTQSGVTLGTFDYISPEQALDPRKADVRSDIYSLGCAFYHALTGRPPVPEGTAARKLAAHANDPVLDPRELNPLVPDDLAAVLARMMAKSPRDRYATPEALARDLTDIGWRLDPAGESLTRVVRPQPNGALVAGLAAAVAGVAVAVGVIGSPQPGGSEPPPFERAPPPAAPPPLADITPALPPATAAAPENAAQLALALADADIRDIRLRSGAVYDLTPFASVVVAPRARLTLSGPAGGVPPELRVRAGVADPASPNRASLAVLNCAEVTLSGVNVRATGSAPAGVERPAALTITGADRIEIRDCGFDSSLTPSGESAGLAVRSLGQTLATLELTNCLFGPGQGVGLQLVGPVRAGLRHAAFAPCVVAVALDSAADGPATLPELSLVSCSFLLNQGAAVEAAGPATVRHEFCVFAAAEPDPNDLMMTDPAEPLACAIRSRQDGPTGAARVQSRPDRKSLIYRADPARTPTRTLGVMAAALAGDAGWAEVALSPWATPDPTPLLSGPQPWEAFRLALRSPSAHAAAPERVVGAVELPRAGSRIYDPWPPAAVEVAPQVRTVCPDVDRVPELGPAQYRTLAEAVAAAGPGETVEIAHAGPLEIGRLTFDRPGVTLTLRAAAGRRPVLTPGPGAGPELIRVLNGTLMLEGLDLVATAPPGAGPGAAVTALGGRLTLKSCTVTLTADDPGQLAALAVPDAAGPGPTVTLEGCLVRGRGVGARVTSGRPTELAARDTLFALSGAVLDTRPAAPTPTRVRFERVTALLSGPLLSLDAAGSADAAAIELNLTRCLVFAPATGPVVAVRGPAAGRLESLRWRVDAQSAFGNVSPFAPWATLAGSGVTERLDAKAFANLVGERPVQLTLESPRGVPALPSELDPGRLVYPATAPVGVGADLSRVARPGE